MSHLPQFRPGLGARRAHESLKQSVAILDQAQHCAVLWFSEIRQRQLYRQLGYSTMRAYAIQALGFSSTRAGDFLRLADKLAELPVLKTELAAGRLGYSQAREIIPVADAANEKDWVRVAQDNPRAKVRAKVKQARQRARCEKRDDPAQVELVPRPASTAPTATVPIAIEFKLSPGQHARYEAVMAKIGHCGSKAELLLAMAEALLSETENADHGADDEPKIARRRATRSPHYQIHIQRCPDCGQTTAPTPRGEMPLSQSEAEVTSCDAVIHEPGQRAKTTIPPKLRREILARDRHQCRRKGCHHTRYLHLHHIVPRARGGRHEAENLVTLCPACHDLWHRQGGDLAAMLTAVPPLSK